MFFMFSCKFIKIFYLYKDREDKYLKQIKKLLIIAMALCLLVVSMPQPAFAYSKKIKANYEKDTPSGIAYSKMEDAISEYVTKRHAGLASVAVGVFDGSDTLCESYFGYADMENKIAADADTVYEWGSISKLFVWVSVMQLYEQGLLDLNANVRDYLPKDFLTKLEYDTPITMQNLMNHTAGWQETTYNVEVSDKLDIVSLEDALKNTEPPQIYQPGIVTAYSNWGTALAAYIVERISGLDYAAYVQESILKPLGMEHTAVKADLTDHKWVESKRQSLKCYSITTESQEEYGTAISYILLYPVGSVTGTLSDFMTFAKAFVTDSAECPLFEKEDTLKIMLTATSFYGDGTKDYGIERNCHGNR